MRHSVVKQCSSITAIGFGLIVLLAVSFVHAEEVAQSQKGNEQTVRQIQKLQRRAVDKKQPPKINLNPEDSWDRILLDLILKLQERVHELETTLGEHRHVYARRKGTPAHRGNATTGHYNLALLKRLLEEEPNGPYLIEVIYQYPDANVPARPPKVSYTEGPSN